LPTSRVRIQTPEQSNSDVSKALLAGTPTNAIPVVKPSTDTRPGVWEYTHNSDTGYLFHLLAGSSFAGPAALIALGLDNGNGGGLLVANKAKGVGIVIRQQATISDPTAYGLKIDGLSTVAPSVRIEQNVAGAGDALQLLAFNSPTDGQLLLRVSAGGGDAGYIYSKTGILEWRRDIQIREKDANTRTNIGVGENGAYAWGDVGGKWSQLAKDRVTFFSSSGGGSLWPYAWVASGSNFNLVTGGAGAFGAVPANIVIAVKNNQIGFLGATAISKRAATADATDLASAITTINALKADLVAYGLKTA
jgi:hypothetical protein